MNIKKANQNVIKYTYRKSENILKQKEKKKLYNNAEHQNVMWLKLSTSKLGSICVARWTKRKIIEKTKMVLRGK